MSAVFYGKKVIFAAQQRLSSMAVMHMHPLTENDKVVSLPKKLNPEVPQFEKYPCFSKLS